MKDKDIIYEIQHGNKELLEILIQKYYDDIYRFCYYKTGNASISYDLVQNVFFKLIKYIGTYKDKGKFKSYLITIAINVCNSYFEENGKYFEELDTTTMYCEDTDKALDGIEKKDSIQKALDILPEKQKEVIILKYYENFKIREIASILDEKIPTIKSRLKQGLEKMHQQLRKEEYND